MLTVELGSYVAHLDPLTGSGLLVISHRNDVWLGTESLDAVEWDSAVTALLALGWEPSEDEHGDLCHEGSTADGRTVIGLYGLAPIVSAPSIEACAEAFAELGQLVGLVR